MWPPASASLRIGRFLDQAEHFPLNQKASVATLRMVFGFSPERCSASARNSVRLPSGMLFDFAGIRTLSDVFGAEMATEVWDRFTVHYTPTHGSWLNQAEIEIGIFARQCLGSRRIPSLQTLRSEARAWNRRMN